MDYLQYRNIMLDKKGLVEVLNLIINGLPSIPYKELLQKSFIINVLNLIINGLPSIQYYS